MTCDNCEYKYTCNKHRVYDEYNDKVTFVEYTDKTCDGFKDENRQEAVTIKDIKPGFIFEFNPVCAHCCNSKEYAESNIMEKTLKDRCEEFFEIVFEYYRYNKYYLSEPAKDALLNAHDCMLVVSGRRDHLTYKFSGCDSHIPYITQLAHDKYFTDQIKEAFHTAYEALIEVFVHRKQNG